MRACLAPAVCAGSCARSPLLPLPLTVLLSALPLLQWLPPLLALPLAARRRRSNARTLDSRSISSPACPTARALYPYMAGQATGILRNAFKQVQRSGPHRR